MKAACKPGSRRKSQIQVWKEKMKNSETSKLLVQAMLSGTCSLVAMTSASDAEGRHLDSRKNSAPSRSRRSARTQGQEIAGTHILDEKVRDIRQIRTRPVDGLGPRVSPTFNQI